MQVKVNLKSRGKFAIFENMETLLSIGDIARRSGVKASAIRYYEERGLIVSIRSPSGRRNFARSTLRRIAFIVFAQRIGLSLDEISVELSKLPKDRTPTKKDWQKLSKKWLAQIDEKIAEMNRLREGLTGCIGCGCLSFTTCKYVNPDDRVFARGAGPRFWL